MQIRHNLVLVTFCGCAISQLCSQRWPELRQDSLGGVSSFNGLIAKPSFFTLEVKSSKSQASGCPRDTSLQGHPAQSSGFGGRSQKVPILQLFFEPDSGLGAGGLGIVYSEVNQRYNEQLFG